MKRKQIAVRFHVGFVEDIFFLVHLVSHLHRSDLAPAHPFFKLMQELHPTGYSCAVELLRDDAFMAAYRRGDCEGVVEMTSGLPGLA